MSDIFGYSQTRKDSLISSVHIFVLRSAANSSPLARFRPHRHWFSVRVEALSRAPADSEHREERCLKAEI